MTNQLKANRLINESSPYLLQHAHNPVDWHAWNEETLAKARQLQKPILLSIGYSACHWCHVMEHESFANQEIANLMNEHYIPIKVDREERPDLDEIYMKAVQLMTGHGGWPMTVFLTYDQKPFFGGTYFPPEDRHGMPGFKRLLTVLAEAWKNDRDKLETSSLELSKYISLMHEVELIETKLDYSLIERSLDKLLEAYDPLWGGFGKAPKFPQSLNLLLMMRLLSQKSKLSSDKFENYLDVVRTSLDKMAIGGMHDQIGGGFARYSVDRKWLVPHFEKMLYDNALLARAYLHGYQLLKNKYWLDVAKDTLDFVLKELTTKDGAFFSSLDADSKNENDESEEGRFYVWTQEEVIKVLGQEDGAWVNDVFGVTSEGNFEHGASVLHFAQVPELLADKYNLSTDQFRKKLEPLKEQLLKAREKRNRPGTDSKILTGWNALMISAFCDGYRVLEDKRYLEAAKNAAQFILEKLMIDNRLLRTSDGAKGKLNAYLEDYSFFIQALLDLATIDFDPIWLSQAIKLTDVMLQHFRNNDDGSLYFTSDDHEELLTRSKNFYDGSIPSATSQATFALLRLAALTNNNSYRKQAQQILNLYIPHANKAPDQFANLLSALDFDLSNNTEIVLVADQTKPETQEFLHLIHSFYLPNAIIALKDIKSKTALDESTLLKNRNMVEDKPTMYICHNYTCEKPITDKETLLLSLKSLVQPLI